MANDKYAEELLSDDELDNVAGGNYEETISDCYELWRRGLLNGDYELQAPHMIEACLHKMGYVGYDSVDFFKLADADDARANIYTDKQGNVITREQFWANFDKENGTKIIR